MMGMEIPVDLINQLKISLRREAKLSSYDPGGEFLPSLPSAAEATAELDASAAYLRCRHCKGKLLRGIESLICVFCGKQQRTSDNPPDPIKLTSTSGYKWLLSSLNLDGSEIVEPPKEMNEPGRGRNAPIEGIAVSKFLDLEIQWGVKEEKSANGGTGNGKSVQSKVPLNLGGFDLDDFFVEGIGDLSKVEVAESKPVEDDFKDPRSISSSGSAKSQGASELYRQENVSLFEGNDAQKSFSSEGHENLSLFAGRGAGEVVSPVEHGNLSLFEGKDVRESVEEHGNLSVFDGKDVRESVEEHGNLSVFEGKDVRVSVEEHGNLSVFEGKNVQESVEEHGNLSVFEGKDAWKSIASKEDENLGLFEGAVLSNAAVKSVDDKFVDSSSDWDTDFQSAKNNLSQEQKSGDLFANSLVDLSAHMDTVFGSGKDLFDAKPDDSSTASVSNTGDWFQDDLFGNVNCEAQKNDSAAHDRNEEQIVEKSGTSSMDIDWIGDDLWQTSDKKTSDKIPSDEDEDWNDFTSSTNLKTPNDSLAQTVARFKEETLDGMVNVKKGGSTQSENSFFPTVNWTEDEKQSTGASMVLDKPKDPDDNFFGAWNSFTTSVSSQIPHQDSASDAKPSAKQNSEINLFGEANDHQGFDFGGFSSSDFFSGGFGDENNSAEVKVMQSETSTSTSTSERTADTASKDQTSANSTREDMVGASLKSKADVVEEVMSQMHDLTFMLGSKLSIPQNSKTE